MRKHTLKPLCLAIGLAMAGSASAVSLDLTGTNFYMKFLDGSQIGAPQNSIDTASGGDQGQFTEMNLTFKATISPKVEAGGRIQSRSSAAYWTEYGGWNENGSVTTTGTQCPPPAPVGQICSTGSSDNNINHQKFMKLRGAYIELSPGYDWLTQVRIGTSDWGMFDPFTVGKVRYIDRDNYNGLYFKGPMMISGSSWELARVSLPSYLQFNWGQGPTCCSTDNTQYNEGVYIAQFKVPVGAAKVGASYMSFVDNTLATTTNTYTGVNTKAIYKNSVLALKAEGSAADGIDLRGAYYRSTSETASGAFGETWGNAPRSNLNDTAIKLDLDWTTPVENLTLSYQFFDIGAGYYSTAAARRESDVLLTEGFESAWYQWGNALWSGGATSDYTQSASNNKITDNDYMDFNESPAESAVGWKGHTVIGKYEVAETPMSLELTLLDYNNNWQNYSATGPLSNFYALNQDRKTNILSLKLNHNFPIMGGLDTNLKFKHVGDKDKVSSATAADDREVTDNGVTASVGNQLFDDLYGTLSFGRYKRDITAGANDFSNAKSILGVKFAYNLPGFELGLLSQWIRGKGNPTETVGANTDIRQYRMKAFAQVNF